MSHSFPQAAQLPQLPQAGLETRTEPNNECPAINILARRDRREVLVGVGAEDGDEGEGTSVRITEEILGVGVGDARGAVGG